MKLPIANAAGAGLPAIPQVGLLVSPGEFYWGGVASTAFWVDPVEEVTAHFFTQLVPSTTYPIRSQLRQLVYSAMV
jgi:CubicO group peptidase (beta-lactamase class C family)